jgi:hypothetical protein
VVLLPESREPAPSGQELRGKGAVPAEPKGSALGRAGGGRPGGGAAADGVRPGRPASRPGRQWAVRPWVEAGVVASSGVGGHSRILP